VEHSISVDKSDTYTMLKQEKSGFLTYFLQLFSVPEIAPMTPTSHYLRAYSEYDR